MKVYRTRVPYDVVARVFKDMGAVIQYDGSEVLLPSGEYVLIFSSEDGGTYYMLPSRGEETIRFVQKVLARANLIVKQQIEEGEKEERKKDTTEVSEFISGTSDSVHGGDSASGEVPEGESGRGQDSSSSQEPTLPQDEAGSGQEEESASSSDAPSLSPDVSSSEREEGESCASDSSERVCASEGEGSSGDGACPKSSECASPDEVGEEDASIDGQASIGEGTGSLAPLSEDILKEILEEEEPGELSTLPSPSGAEEGEAPGPEREVSPSLSYKELRKIMSRGFATTPSTHSNSSFGGVFGKLELIKDPPSQILVNRARRVFARLVSAFGEGSEGPRWDYKKVSTRIASYQNWRVSDRKKEFGRPAIVVFSDVSGSMDLFAKEVLMLAKTLMKLGISGGEIIAIVNSNGYPLELWVNGRKVEEFERSNWYGCSDDFVISWYRRVFESYNARIAVLAADWDGEWLYKRIAEESFVDRIYWLDVKKIARSDGPAIVELTPELCCYDWSSEALKKVVYVCNCQSVEDFVRGLELAITRRPLKSF
jgi:hypothetical protein